MNHTAAPLDAYFRNLEAQDQYSGVVLITQGAEQRFSGAYGYASRAWRVRPTLKTRFDTASVTKLFTAVVTLQCVDAGLFDLDTSAVDYLDLRGTAISPAVTVAQLLTHSSGIGDDCEEEAGERYEDLWKTRPNYVVTTTVDFLPQFVHKPPNFTPGQGCRYCNCGYVLLGLMVEKATGHAYRDVVQERVFTPAGMAHSGFLRMDQVYADVAEGCDPLRDESGALVAWKRNIYTFPPIGSPDSGAYVTAGDLDRFLRAVCDGQLLSPASTAAFLTPQVHYRQQNGQTIMVGYGLAFYMKEDQVICYQKEGINAGVSAVIRRYPDQDLNVVLLSNMEDGVWNPLRELHKRVMAGDFLKPDSLCTSNLARP